MAQWKFRLINVFPECHFFRVKRRCSRMTDQSTDEWRETPLDFATPGTQAGKKNTHATPTDDHFGTTLHVRHVVRT